MTLSAASCRRSGRGGKLKTVTQTVALAMLIAPLQMFSGSWEPVGEVLWWVAAVTMGAAVALTVLTGLDYVRETIAARRAQTAGSTQH